MSQTKTPSLPLRKLSPYLLFGLLLFLLNSALSLNYWLKGYLTILELQAGILLIYFVLNKLKKQGRKS